MENKIWKVILVWGRTTSWQSSNDLKYVQSAFSQNGICLAVKMIPHPTGTHPPVTSGQNPLFTIFWDFPKQSLFIKYAATLAGPV